MTFKPFRFALLALVLIFSLVRCGADSPTGVVAIALDLSTATLRVGTTVQVNATVTVGGVASTQTVTFSSDNSAVLSVTPGGLIRALTIGTANLTATASSGETKTALVTVIAGLPFSVQKTAGDGLSATAGTATAAPPAVIVRDSAGNALSGVTVTFAVASGGGSVTGGSTTTNASGTATAGAWTLGPNAGANTLTATATGVAAAATFSATATAPVPTSISINGGNGQTAGSGLPVPVAPSVIVRNNLGQPAAGVTVFFSVGAGGGVVTGGTQVTNASGIATVGSWNLGAAGVNTLNATAAGLTPVTFTATATAPPSNTMSSNAGNGQSATAGTAVAIAPSVIVVTSTGQPVPGTPVTFAVASGGGSITGAAATTNASGIATVGSWTLGAVGANTLTATSSGLGTVTFTATATAAPVGSLALSNSSLSFAGIANGTTPPAQTIQVTNSTTGTLSGLATGPVTYTGTGSGWLFASLSGTSAPATLTVSVATTLPPGTYGASFQVTAAAANSPQTVNVTLTVVPASQIIVTQQPSGASTGVVLSTQPIVRVADGFGSTITGFNGAVSASLVGSGGVLGGTTSVNAVNGIATFTNLVVTGAGTYTLAFSAPGASGTSASFVVTALPPTKLGIATNAAGAVSNTTFSTQPVVELRDVNGNLVTGATNNVTVALGESSGGGTLSGTLTVAAVNGVARFTDLKISAVGSYTLSFSSGTLTGITSSPFPVTASPPVSLGISTQPVGAQTGSVLTTQPVVQVRDFSLATVAGATNAVTATLNGAGGTLSGTTTVNAVNGVATFTDLKITGSGTYTITFNAGSLTPATSGSIVVAALPPTQLAIGTQPVGGGTGLLLPTQPVIQVKDAANGVVNGATNAVTAALVGAGGTLSGTTTVNAVNGVATFTDLRITGVGSYTLTFTSGTLTSVTSATITISTLPPTKLVIQTQPSASTLSGSVFATQPVVQVQDQSSGVVAAANNAVTATLSGGGGTLSGTTTVNAVNGIATFTDLKVTGAGNYTIVFSASALTSATSASITITPLPPTQLTMQTQPGGASANAIFTTQPIVQVRDASNGLVAGASDAVTATLVGSGGTLSGTTTVNAVNGIATFTNLKVSAAGTYSITFSSGSLTSVTSAPFTVTINPAVSIALNVGAAATASAAVGTNITIPIGIDMANAQGQNLASLTFKVTWDPAKFDYVTRTNGTFGTGGSFTVNTANTATGELAVSIFDNDGFSTGAPTILNVTLSPKVAVAGSTVTASVSAAGDVNGVSLPPGVFAIRALSVTTAAAPATKLAIQAQPSGAVSGSNLTNQPVIQVQDASSGVVVAATNSVTATLVGGGGTLSGTTTVNAVNGIATFTDLRVTGAGNYTITFSSGTLVSATSNSITITPQAATKLAIATQPVGGASGDLMSTQPVVQIQDATGGVVAGATNSVTATLTGTGTLSGTTTVAAVAGVATFTDLRITGAGNSSIVFTSGTLASATSNPISTSALPPTKVVIATQPVGGVSASPLSTQPVVQLQDASNGVVAGASNSVTAALVGSGGALSGTTTVNAVNGVATFTDLVVTGAGTYTITFTSGTLTSTTSGSITITPQPATKLAVSTQPAGAGSGELLSSQPVVQILNASNGIVTDATNSVTATLSGTGTLSGTTTVAAVSGVATFTDLRITGAGTSTIVFTSGTLTSATSNSISTSALPATKVVIATQPSGAASGSVLATQPVVQLQDASNNVVAGAGNSVTATLNGAGGTLSGTTTVNAVNGTATFTDLKVTGAGNYTITFTSGTLSSATSNSITITALPATHLFVAVQPSNGATSGQPFASQPVVHILDDANSIVTTASTSVTATLNGAGGQLFGTTTKAAVNGVVTFTDLDVMPAGTYTITFAGGGLTPATSATFIVVSGAAHHLAVTTQPTGNVSGSNLNTQPVVRVEDVTSSPVTGGSFIVTATLDGSGGTLGGTTSVTTVNGVATFTNLKVTGAGSYTITFIAGGLNPATSNSITITPQTATQLAITTQPSPNVTGGVAFPTQPVIEIRDGSGNRVAGSTASVTATVNGPGNLQGTTTVNAVDGIATFTNLNLRPAGTVTLTFTSSGVTSVTSNSITTVAGPPAVLHMTTQPVGAASGQPLATQPVIDVRDNASSVAITATNPVTATLNGAGGTLSGTTTVNAVNGLATFTNLVVTGEGSYTLTFSSSGLTPVNSASFTVTPNTASIGLNVGTNATANAAVGTNIVVPIIADMSNAQGQNLASLTFNFTWDPAKFDYVSRTNGTFGGGASYTVNTANTASGTLAVSIFDNDGFSTGTPTILSVTLSPKVAVTGSPMTVSVSTAGDVNGSTIPTGKFVVRPLSVTTTGAAAPTATKLGIQTQPGGAISGSAINPQPVIQVQDVSSVTVPGNAASVTATLNGAGGTLSGTTTVNAVNGVATFTNLVVTGAGSYTLTFASSGLTAVTSNSITITAPSTPSQLAMTTQPSGAVSGAAFTTQPVVEIRNASNVLVNTANNAVTATLNGAGGTLIGTATVNAVNGVATFTGLGITGAGSYTITFSSSGLTPVTSSSITVTTPAGPTINLLVGANSTATATNGTNFTVPITADMSNAQGQNLASLTFQVTWDNTKFDYVSRTNGTFGEGPSFTVNTSQTANGILNVSVFDNDGFSTGAPVIFSVTLLPKASATNTPVTMSVSTAGDVNGSTIPSSKIVVRPLSVTTP